MRGWHHHVIAVVSRLVPAVRRDEWRREWEAELRYLELTHIGRETARRMAWILLLRSVGSPVDALYIRLSSRRARTSPSFLSRLLSTVIVLTAIPLMMGAVVGLVGAGRQLSSKWSMWPLVALLLALLWLVGVVRRRPTARRVRDAFVRAVPLTWVVMATSALSFDMLAIHTTRGFYDWDHFVEYFFAGLFAFQAPIACVICFMYLPVMAAMVVRMDGRATPARLARTGALVAPVAGLLMMVLVHLAWGGHRGIPAGLVADLSRFFRWPLLARILALGSSFIVGGVTFGGLFARAYARTVSIEPGTAEPQNPRTIPAS